MSRQRTPYDTGRSLGRAGVLVGTVLWLSLSSSPAAHAGDGGLLGGTGEVVEGAAGQVVDPVLQTAQSPVPQPVQQAVEPVIPQAVAPVPNQPAQTAQTVVRNTEQTTQTVVRNTEQTAQTVVRNTEQTAQTVVRNTEQTAQTEVRDAEQTVQATVRGGKQASEPVVRVVEPADRRVPAPGAAQPSVTASTAGSHTDGGSVRGGAQHVLSGAHAPVAGRRPASSAAVVSLFDLAPRAGTARPILGAVPQVYVLRDSYDPRSDQHVWTLTNKLMHMWAAPGGVDAGLSGDEGPGLWRPGAFDPLPLSLGLLLGFLSLVLARRSRQSTGVTARPTR